MCSTYRFSCFFHLILTLICSLLTAVSVFAADTTLSELCLKDELYHRSHCYHFKNDVGMSFEAARTYCIKRQSHMVIINDAEENRWLLTQDHTRFGRWIGMMRVDEGTGFQFHWVVDDSMPAWVNFNDAKMDYDEQKCIYMDTDGRWADNTCSQPYNVMCERNPLDASIIGLQKSLNDSFAGMQRRLAKLEGNVANLTRVSGPGSGPNVAAAAAKLDKNIAILTQLVAQTNKDAKDLRKNATATSGDMKDTLQKLSKTVKVLSTQLDNTTLSAQHVRQQLDDIQQKLDAANFQNAASEANLNATAARLEALLLSTEGDKNNTDGASAAALRSSGNLQYGSYSILYSRVPLALMLLLLFLQIAGICIVVLFGLFLRRRHKMEQYNNQRGIATPFQYNVSTASFGGGGRGGTRGTRIAASSRSSSERDAGGGGGQLVYEELDTVRGRRTPVMRTSDDNNNVDRDAARSPSVNTMRTDSIYMLSTVDGGAALDEELAAAARKRDDGNVNDVESSAGTSAHLPRILRQNNYEPASYTHNTAIVDDDKQKFVQLELLRSPAPKMQ